MFKRRLLFRSFGPVIGGPILAAAVWLVAGRAVAQPELAIGVISPLHGRSASAGRAHEDTIRRAFREMEDSPLTGSGRVRLRAVYKDDGGDPTQSAAIAKELVEQEHVVAIVGPVNSGCTEEVLKLGLPVPIISAMSTAATLTEQEHHWFFRATVDDRERMMRVARALTDSGGIEGTVLLLHEDDAYGRGLAGLLREDLGVEESQVHRWEDVLAGGAAGEVDMEAVERGEGISPAFVDALPSDGPIHIFVLGTEQGTAAIVRGLDSRLHGDPRRQALHFFFVGMGPLLQSAPEGSLTIGEPVKDTDDIADPSFLLTAYEAVYYILRGALLRTLEHPRSLQDVQGLREALRTTLETSRFDSSVPWRKIEFDTKHNLQDPPSTPLYEIARSVRRVSKVAPPPWVGITVPRDVRVFEQPVTVALEGHGFPEGEAIELSILRGDRDDVLDRATVKLAADRGSYEFFPLWPGDFVVRTNRLQAPIEAVVSVRWTWNYLLVCIAAAVGAALASLYTGGMTGKAILWRIAVGFPTAIVLFGVASFAQAVPALSSLPVPAFGAQPELNACVYGFASGWSGPSILGFFSRWLGGRKDDATATPPTVRAVGSV